MSAGSLDHGIYKNFQLRTIGVVTLAPIRLATALLRYRSANYALRRNWLPSSSR